MDTEPTAGSATLNPRHARASRKTKAIATAKPAAPAKAKGKPSKASAKPPRQTPPKRERRVKFLRQVADAAAPIDSVRPHPKNANAADAAQLAESVDENGFFGFIVVQDSTGYVIAGNNRWLFLKSRGEKTVPITRVDVDDETAERILAADNATAALGKRDPSKLEALLASITGGDASKLKGTGYRGVSGVSEMMDRIKAGQKKPEPSTPFDDDEGGERSGQDEHDDAPDPEDRESSSRSDAKSAARHPLPIVLTNAEKRDWDRVKAGIGKRHDGFCFRVLLAVYQRASEQGLLDQLRAEPEE